MDVVKLCMHSFQGMLANFGFKERVATATLIWTITA